MGTTDGAEDPVGQPKSGDGSDGKQSILKEALLVGLGAVILTVLRPDLARAVLTFSLTMGFLVAIHEWGHFIAGRAAHVRIFEFALGWGPKALTYLRRNGTEYTLRWIPIGGFVHLKGMQPEDEITEDGVNGRRAAERALIYLGGPLMNVVFAVLVFCTAGFFFGVPDDRIVLVGDIRRRQEAERMQVVSRNGAPASDVKPGLRIGDQILEVNGKSVVAVPGADGSPLDAALAVTREINPNLGQRVTLLVRRGSDQLMLTGTPQPLETSIHRVVVRSASGPDTLDLRPGDQIETIDGRYLYSATEDSLAAARRLLAERQGKEATVGVWRDGKSLLEIRGRVGDISLSHKQASRTVGILGFTPVSGVGARSSLPQSIQDGLAYLQRVLGMYAAMLNKPKEAGESVGGVIQIAVLLSQVGNLPVLYLVMLIGQLSLSLAVFNLVPIPLLDGGHMLLLTLEVLRRRRLEPEIQRAAQMVGVTIVAVLFVLITFRDVWRALAPG